MVDLPRFQQSPMLINDYANLFFEPQDVSDTGLVGYKPHAWTEEEMSTWEAKFENSLVSEIDRYHIMHSISVAAPSIFMSQIARDVGRFKNGETVTWENALDVLRNESSPGHWLLPTPLEEIEAGFMGDIYRVMNISGFSEIAELTDDGLDGGDELEAMQEYVNALTIVDEMDIFWGFLKTARESIPQAVRDEMTDNTVKEFLTTKPSDIFESAYSDMIASLNETWTSVTEGKNVAERTHYQENKNSMSASEKTSNNHRYIEKIMNLMPHSDEGLLVSLCTWNL